MSRGQAKSNIKNEQPQLLSPGKRPRGIKKQQTLRKSPRLQAIPQVQKQSLSRSNYPQEVQAPLSPLAGNITALQRPQTPDQISTSSRKRKRGEEAQEAGHSLSRTQERPPFKRLPTPPSNCINEEKSHQQPAADVGEVSTDPLEHWIKTGKWLKEYFEQDNQVREDFERGKSLEEVEQRDRLEEYITGKQLNEMEALIHPHYYFARPPLTRQESQSLKSTVDQRVQGSKISQYNTPDYAIRLQQKGSYMDRSPLGITDTSRHLCRTLLETEQSIPHNTLFSDDLFDKTCDSVRDRNEAIIIRDVTPLICPSAQVLRIRGAEHLDILDESVNEAWSNTNTYVGTLPQPDYAVGFGISAFTREQLEKLKPFVGEPGFRFTTYFMATRRIYFPFFTCEVKCGASNLDIADRQNAQSMSVALRALVVLFRYVKREKEVNREILAFSISHNDRSVRIYGHYPVIEGDKTTFYRHPIHEFSFIGLDGKEKWTAYKFTKNIYNHYMPKLHKLIHSAIDDLPAGINFDLSQSASFPSSAPPSSQPSNTESAAGEDESQSSLVASQDTTPTTAFTHATTEPASKKPRNE